MLKKASILFLILNILYLSFGYFFVFKTIQKSIKKEIKSILKQDLLKLEPEVFRFKSDIYTNQPENFKWYENNKEFFYFDKLYDIVKTEVSGNELIIYAINDTKEQMLVKNFNSINNYTGTQLPLKAKIQNLLTFLQLTYIQSKNTLHFYCNQNILTYFDIKNLYEFQSLYNSHHPPKG